MVTVLALPINLTSGLFGMNVGGIPCSEYGHGLIAIVIGLLSVTACSPISPSVASGMVEPLQRIRRPSTGCAALSSAAQE